MTPTDPSLSRLARAARATEVRLRASEALRFASTGLVPTLTAGVALVTLVKVTHHVHGPWVTGLTVLTAAGAAATLAAVVFAFARRYPALAGAVRLDRAHDLHDRVASALAFGALSEGERSPLMNAAIDDAIAHAGGLSPAKAAPVRVPGDLGVAAALACGLALVSALQWSSRTPVPRAATIEPVALSADDVELFRDTLAELARQDSSPEVRVALEKFNTLVEDIAKKRIDRDEAFRRMGELERDLLAGREADQKSLDEALKQTADELKKSPLSKPAGEALAKKDFAAAQKAMKDLAAKIRDPKAKVSDEEKKRLKEALAAAAKKQKETLDKLRQRRDELRASLLQREQKLAQNQTDEEKRLLQRDKRELERLDREVEQKEQAGRQLDRLDRELSQAAEDLLRDLGLSADDLEKGAEDINRMAQNEMTEQEKEELRQKLQELRELLRQEGQGGEQLRKRLRKFAKRARGEQGGSGEKGAGQKQPGQGGDEGDEEDDEGDDGKQPGQKKGQGQGQGQGEWVIGPGGKKMFVLRGSRGQGQQGQGQGQGQPGQGQGQGQGQGPGGDQPGGQGKEAGGTSWGSGHDANVAGKSTGGKFGTHDVEEAAADTGQGPNVSETIHGAAERGFSSKGYKKVYTDYRTKAEEAMKNEEIPPGYRFYVRRYFQLIRPRDEAAPAAGP